ncbi:tail fiber domain-containing protein [Escherichia coli]|uniref:Tail fiber n=1 Tax=Escherichia phage mEpX2 TaxID=1147154 RepID=K7PGY2_9CAUD|nr:tail fiber protein [Escherichia phage mEpX2]AFM75929.1 tail fiber [Escherichia phage mEpX2]EFD5088371.1 tail fiber domain-containing protein [Escherichia coli]EFD5323884.1 tail fiber domain-containing protein [Escherichia coli]EFD7746911.1 tail fiber domain-containing protein [Escherichia coli]
MLYNTGTIAINGNSATGTGTNWTAPASQVRAGQTIIVMSNPVQLFQISSVNSATSMTVTPAASPALSGQKYGILVSDNISVDGLALAMSQLIKEYDENIGAWETFATTSANQSITVTINGTAVTIPGIGKLAQKGSNGAVTVADGGTGATNAADARTNLSLGNSATRDVGTETGTVAAGDDPRLNTVNGKTSGVVKGDFFTLDNRYGHTTQLLTYNPGTVGTHFGGMSMKRPNSQGWILSQYTTTDYEVQSVTIGIDAPGANVNWIFNRNGQATGTWVNNSDSRIKKDIKPIPDPLVAMKKIRGCSWTRLDSGVTGFGFIAQEVQEVFPEAVHDFGQSMTMEDGKEVENVLSVDTSGVSAALHHEAILALMVEIEELKTEMKSLTGVGR